MRVRFLGWEDPLAEGMASHSSILAWRIPWTEETCGLPPIVLQSQTQLKQLSKHTGNDQHSNQLTACVLQDHITACIYTII